MLPLSPSPGLLDELIDGAGALPQARELLFLLCHCFSIWICEHEVNLGLELIHHHWHLGGAKDLLDLVSHPCPGSSTLHV